jgi:hypothetical protein
MAHRACIAAPIPHRTAMRTLCRPALRANIPSVTVATSEADMTPRIRQTLSTWSVNGSLVTITGDTMPPRDPNDDDDDEDDDDAEPDEDSEPAVVREPDE